MPTTLPLIQTFTADGSALSEVRMFVRARAEEANLAASATGDLVIAVTEACNEMLAHEQGSRLLVSWWVHDDVVENALRLREITLRHVGVGDTDLHGENPLAISDCVGDVRGLRVGAGRSFPIAVAAGSAADGDIRFDRQTRVLFRARDFGDGGEHVGRQSPARFIVEGTTVREKRRADDIVDCRALGRFIANVTAMHPEPAPTSTTTELESTAKYSRAQSTRSSVSGRGISRAGETSNSKP